MIRRRKDNGLEERQTNKQNNKRQKQNKGGKIYGKKEKQKLAGDRHCQVLWTNRWSSGAVKRIHIGLTSRSGEEGGGRDGHEQSDLTKDLGRPGFKGKGSSRLVK